MRLRPIAFVRNGIDVRADDWDVVESKLVFDPEYVPGLEGLERFKHIWVIFGFHRRRGWLAKVHPMHDPSRPIVGVFATRSPTRPNKIGLTRVELLESKGRTLTVRGLDALDGSPVWDVKPCEDEIEAAYGRRRPRRKKTR